MNDTEVMGVKRVPGPMCLCGASRVAECVLTRYATGYEDDVLDENELEK